MTVSPLAAFADEHDGWLGRYLGERGNIGLPLNVTSQTLEASHIVKGGAGTCFGLSGFNNGGAALFVQLFDAAAVPANGAVPGPVLNAPAGANFSIDFGTWGRAFNAGLVVCASTTVATLTLAGASCWFDVQYV